MKRKMAVIGISVVFLMMAVNAFSWQRGCPAQKGYRFCQAVLNLEGLTVDQRTEINSMQKAFFDDTNSLKETLCVKRGELNTLLSQVPVDAEQAANKQKEIFEISQSIQEKSLAFKISVLEKLTPDQAANISFSGCRKMGCQKMSNCPKATGACCGCGMGKGMGGGCQKARCPML